MDTIVFLDGRVTMGRARRAVAHRDDDTTVVVSRRRGLVVDHTLWRVGDLREVDADDDTPLQNVLAVDSADTVPTWDPAVSESPPAVPAVVIGPDGPVGVEWGERAVAGGGASPWWQRQQRTGRPTTRSWDPVEAAPPPPTSAPPPPAPSTRASTPPAPPSNGPGTGVTRSANDPGDGSGEAQDVHEAAGGAAPAADGARRDLEVHPRLEAPDQVASGAEFEVIVGLGEAPMPGTAGGPMRLEAVGETVELVVQLVADGFTMPTGSRRFLHVVTDAPAGGEVDIDVVAPRVTEPWRGTLEVQYAHDGTPIGRAWREVVVTPTAARVDAEIETGSTPMVVSGPGAATDLTAVAVDGDEPGTLLWTLFSPHEVTLPTEPAVTELDAANARAFALEQVLTIGRSSGSALEVQELTGVSRTVADAMPPAFWEALAAVAGAVDHRPSVLLVTSDPWVPWELAATGEDYLPPEVVDAEAPAFLGAQFVVGRWLQPARVGRVERPSLPPPARHDIGRLCLVIGDYAAERGQRPLPEAIEEGNRLADRYPSVWRSATADDLAEVLGDRIRERGSGVTVDALHMACHGQVSGDNERYSGIVLSDDERRLTATIVKGSSLARNRHPFVFLNACQVGQATEGLGDYGGMAGAFVREGASGFVAPLWEVDDLLAQQAALGFYETALEDGVSVGEALRRFRAGWRSGESTRLAYVFYGHPGLQLRLADAPAPD